VMADRFDSRFLLPVLRWLRVGQTRRWLLDPIEDAHEALLAKATGRDLGDFEAGRPAGEPIAGLLAVPYFLPRLTRSWPKMKSLTPEGRGHFRGPAQVPVLALIHRRALLNSAFVKAAESLADAGLRD